MQNKKVVDYQIIQVLPDKHDEDVASLLSLGYQPWGSPCPAPASPHLFQAFVKYEDD